MNYNRIGDYIKRVSLKNSDGAIDILYGINIDKFFMPSVANVIGTDLSRYKVVTKNQFACNRMHVGRDKRLPISLSLKNYNFIVSPAYDVFEIIDTDVILPEYLMMWFTREEFDRNCWFHTDSDVRGKLDWNAFMDMKLPIPSIEKQRQIVAEYDTVTDRIKLNEELNLKLEETAQALYKHWFVDFEFPNNEGKPYKSSGGTMVYNEELDKEIPVGWEVNRLSQISEITMGQSPSGESYNDIGIGDVFYQGRTDFGFRLPTIRVYTSEPKRVAKKGDILMSVRAPVGDLNIANSDCCIGRGLASIRSTEISYTFCLMKDFKKLFDSNKGSGTIFSSINKDELFDLKVIYDKETAILFNESIKRIDQSINEKSEQIVILQELKNLLLAKMTKLEPEKEIIS